MNGLTRMVKKKDYGLFGITKDRRRKKEITRMGNLFLGNVGMKMEMKKSVINPRP